MSRVMLPTTCFLLYTHADTTHTRRRVMSQMSHVTNEWVMSCCLPLAFVTWLIHLWHDSHLKSSRITCAWVTFRIFESHIQTYMSVTRKEDESCLVRMGHVNEIGWVMAHVHESCCVYTSIKYRHVYECNAQRGRVMSRMNGSCQQDRIKSCHICMSHITYVRVSSTDVHMSVTCKEVASCPVWMIHVIYEWARICMCVCACVSERG